MDPYLERNWQDVHSRFVAYSADALSAVLPDDLIVRMEERVAIESEDEMRRRVIAPDVRVFEPAAGNAPHAVAGVKTDVGGQTTAVAEPVILTARVDPLTERYITVIEANTGKLVTVLEFLSPTNKRPGEAMEDYRQKRRELRGAGVNLVEVDLVRQGSWTDLLAPYVAPSKYHTAYRVTVRRIDRPNQVLLYPVSLRQRLPAIPVPLRPADADVPLDLQVTLDLAYRNGRYDRTVDYTQPCEPPIQGSDAAWADELLRAAGRR